MGVYGEGFEQIKSGIKRRKMNTKSKKILSEIKAYFIIAVGLLCYVLAWSIFILPNNMVGGGVTGIAAIIQY